MPIDSRRDFFLAVERDSFGQDNQSINQSDGGGPVILEFWGMWSTLLLPSLTGPLWPGMVTPDWVLYKGQIELFDI